MRSLKVYSVFKAVLKTVIGAGPCGRRMIAGELDQASEGHLVDALALRGDEGRGTLR